MNVLRKKQTKHKAFSSVVLYAITNIFMVKKKLFFASHFDTHKFLFLITAAIQNCYF